MNNRSRIYKILTAAEDFLIAFDDFFRRPYAVMRLSGENFKNSRKTAERLVKEGILTSDFSAKVSGENLLNLIKKPWDGQWRLVSFDIPEKEKKKRQEIRAALWHLGFRRLQLSAWISPLQVDDFVYKLMKKIGKPQNFFLFIGKIEDSDPKVLVADLWETKAWKEKAQRLLRKFGKTENKIPFLREFWDLVFAHPLVPFELLPYDWPLEGLVKAFVKRTGGKELQIGEE